jgi:uncharacterized protein YukJ
LELKQYTLMTGRVLDRRAETTGRSPHYQILLSGGGEQFRVAVNTRSGSSRDHKSELLYFADDDFRHPITDRLANVADGPLEVASHPHALALDYQRGGMFDRRYMRRIPSSLPGPHNDLTDELGYWVERAIADPAIRLHAFGTRWGPESHEPDQVFRFTPGNGIHDVHMNQGNWDEHRHDNRIWADGGLLFQETRHDRWCAILLAFQTQSWHTDDHGNPILWQHVEQEREERRDGVNGRWPARISGAFVHPNDEKTGVEHVTIWNSSNQPLAVAGWRLMNRAGDAVVLEGAIPSRRGRRFPLPDYVSLSSRGGLIRLLDREGAVVDGVSYTRQEARRKRGAIRF